MKLTNVKNEQAVTRVLTYVRVLERYLSLTHSRIKGDMSRMDSCNMIALKRHLEQDPSSSHPFRIVFPVELKKGLTIWTASCRLNSDYYSIAVEDISYRYVNRLMYPGLFVFGVDCELGFLSFCEVPDSFKAVNLLIGCIDERNMLYNDLRSALETIETLTRQNNDLETTIIGISKLMDRVSPSNKI